MELAASQSYANFRAWVPRNVLPIGVLHPISWIYYDWGPRTYPEPLLCLHSLIGSAESYYHQVIALAPRGYRILSVQIPVYWTVAEFCDAFHAFLDMLSLRRIHIYGAGLGGFLALHYSVRKPERIASLVLTHSFLTTENLNLRIPYSAAMLRWLPDFLVRSTMRAILPKGRTTVEMANAAEFAIGHTMPEERDVLASRLALSVTESSVISRLHIPETRFTLVDTLDRPSKPALDLSQETSKHLPEARRALLNRGGNFPYLSVPDDVNMHLLVHLRRNAPEPVGPIPIPPPARPRPLPTSALRRRSEGKLQKEPKNEISDCTHVRRSKEELENEARAIVAAEESTRIERFAFEIGRLREFLPGRADTYLSAVIEKCDGNLHMAIGNAMEDMYGDDFYTDIARQALDDAILSLEGAEEPVKDQTSDSNPDNTDEIPNLLETNSSSGLQSEAYVMNGESDGNHHGDPLQSRGLLLENSALAPEPLSTAERGNDKTSTDGEDNQMTLSPVVRSTDVGLDDKPAMRDNVSGIFGEDCPIPEMQSAELGSAEEIVDLKGETPGDAAVSLDQRRVESEGSIKRPRRSRRRSYPPGTRPASVSYGSPKHADIRSPGPLVGRGPAPFSNATGIYSSSEAWTSPPQGGEDHERGNADETTTLIASGASLLDNVENPLELPAHESSYRSETRRPRAFGGTPSDRRYPISPGGQNPGGPQLVSRKNSFPLDDSPKVSAGPKQQERGILARGDEWDAFRAEDLVRPTSAPPVGFTKGTEKDQGLENTGAETEVDELERLKEWSMSAHAASKNVHR